MLLAALGSLDGCGVDSSMQPDDYMVPMRDGTRLHTRVWRPAGAGPHPSVLTRGYRPSHRNEDPERFVQAGYVFVGQATRGHGESGGANGVRDRFFYDAKDGYDTLTWIAAQDWSDGNIAMYGKSYWGTTQWLLAPEQHPNLKAIVPQNINADLWQCAYWCNGALSLAMTASGRAFEDADEDEISQMGWDSYFRHLPLISMDAVVSPADRETKGAAALWRDYVSHSTFDEYWKAISIHSHGDDGKYARIQVPVFLMAGWYDYYTGAAFNSYRMLNEVSQSPEVRIVVNPSDHLNRVVPGRDFGSHADKDEAGLAIRWLDHIMRGVDDGISEEPPISVFVMGENRWRHEETWPPRNAALKKFYFSNRDGDRFGELSEQPPGEESPSAYRYDPRDPVPTLGGNHSFIKARAADYIVAGPVDQRPNEQRHDVLVFSSEPLQSPVEVTGPVTVRLHASSSARDTDFVARLIDVYPDGRAVNLTEGVIRARFRESLWEPPRLLEPGEIHEYTIELQPTSNVFLRGHRIRVHITSSSFPLWDRNPNTGLEQGMYADLQVAQQTIFHDQARASHILLPVIESGGE
jgi:hypothetical protein